MKAPAKSSGSSSPAASILEPSLGADPGRKPGEGERLGLFSLLAEHDHEQRSEYYEPSCGYRGLIGIHSTGLGPAGGGPRLRRSRTDGEARVGNLRVAAALDH